MSLQKTRSSLDICAAEWISLAFVFNILLKALNDN